MAFCRVVFPLLVLSVISCYASNVPVIIWGNLHGTSLKADPLSVISEGDLKNTVREVLEDDPVTIVFVEETLSVEDFSRKEADGTSFPYLHGNINKAIYLPNVENPLLALKSLENGEETSIVLTENGLTEDLPAKGSNSVKFVIINLKDAGEDESRPAFLRRHDRFMQDTMLEMQKRYGNVIAIYTAENPSWIIPQPSHSRVRRDTNTSTPYTLGNLRLSVNTIILESKNRSITLPQAIGSEISLNVTTLNATLAFGNDINVTMNFYIKAGYWFFNSVTLVNASITEELYPVGEEVFAIVGFSYRCAQRVKFASVNETNDYTINFNNMKVQPFFENVTEANQTPAFGESFNCVGFFTAPIWAGLFVVAILLLITFYGIMMMMDIRTMDRFDDPKGKTITINAAE